MTLWNSYGPNTEEIIKHCLVLGNEDDIMKYLAEVASYDFSCPDKCDEWATNFYIEHKDEFEDLENRSIINCKFCNDTNLGQYSNVECPYCD